MRNDTGMFYTSTFIRMAVSYLFMASSFGAFFLLPLFIIGHGGSKADTGILMGAFGLSSVLCRPWISNMIDRIGRKKSYTLGSIIMVALPLAYLPLRENCAPSTCPSSSYALCTG